MLEQFEERFEAATSEARRMCFPTRVKQLQLEAIDELDRLAQETAVLKKQAIDDTNEDVANFLLAHELTIHSLRSELEMWIALKDDEPDKAWDSLVTAQGAIAAAMRAHEQAAHLGRYGQRLQALERALFPPQMYMSPGFTVAEAICSICESVYGRCNHVVGRAYMGRMCSRIVTKAKELREISLVTEPADKRARVRAITDEAGKQRHYLSWRVISPEDS